MRIDLEHCWLVLVDTPNSDGHAVVMMPAETFDIEAVLGLRDQIGERATVSIISDESIAYCEATSDLKVQLEQWLKITLEDPQSEDDEAAGDITCDSMLCSQASCAGCPLDEVTP